MPLKIALASKPYNREVPPPTPELAALLDRQYAEADLVSEVEFWTSFFLIADSHGMTDDAFVEWCRELNAETLSHPIYAIFTLLASPAMMIRGVASRYRTFHPGSDLMSQLTGEKSAALMLTFPMNLFNNLALRALATAFEIGLTRSRGRNPKVIVADSNAAAGRLRATWD